MNRNPKYTEYIRISDSADRIYAELFRVLHKERNIGNKITNPPPVTLSSIFDEGDNGFILPDKWITNPDQVPVEGGIRRDFLLPINSQKVIDKVGKDKVRLKFSVLLKNADPKSNHRDLTADDSRLILDAVLNLSGEQDIVFQCNESKPEYYMLVKFEKKSATARIDISGQDAEFIGWHWMRTDELNRTLRNKKWN